MDLAALTARLNDLGGFDLKDSEAADLLNDGLNQAARRSRYPRKTIEAGPTVEGQAAYTLPEDFLLPLGLTVAGTPWATSDPATVDQFQKTSLVLGTEGVWYEDADEEGNRTLYLYPTPGGESTLTLSYVFSPTPLNVDEPNAPITAFPDWWQPSLRFFAAAVYYETVEDNEELAEAQEAKAEKAIGDLLRYDHERRGGGQPFVMGISGVTA